MTRYLGTKEINAKPMNRLDYNKFRGWDLPSDENGADDGYLVEYIAGGKANTKEYKGYVSWSPKDVFDEAYKIYDTYLDRLNIELTELTIKVNAASKFIASQEFEKLDSNDLGLLREQVGIMNKYINILEERIALNK